jgi:hypothetical protein
MLALIDDLCKSGKAKQEALMKTHDLPADAIGRTILGHVSTAIHGGRVPLPEDGGWYVSFGAPRRFVVAPGFRAAWLALRGLVKKSAVVEE